MREVRRRSVVSHPSLCSRTGSLELFTSEPLICRHTANDFMSGSRWRSSSDQAEQVYAVQHLGSRFHHGAQVLGIRIA